MMVLENDYLLEGNTDASVTISETALPWLVKANGPDN